MLRLRFAVVCLVVCACAIPLRLAATSDPLLAGELFSVPLPLGREMTDDELLQVEGEIAFLLALAIATVVGAVTGGGIAAINENWLDEDYGIDGDDWPRIGFGALGGAMFAASGAMVGHYVGPM